MNLKRAKRRLPFLVKFAHLQRIEFEASMLNKILFSKEFYQRRLNSIRKKEAHFSRIFVKLLLK
jgi:hypothetical protein